MGVRIPRNRGVLSNSDTGRGVLPFLHRASPSSIVAFRLRWVLLLALFIASATFATNGYVYDAAGRLRAITNTTPGSTASRYVYDNMGNLLNIVSVPASQLSIFGFSPWHGAVGATVVITGQNFSTTAANNVVQFNGVAATVTTALATQLNVKVPSGGVIVLSQQNLAL